MAGLEGERGEDPVTGLLPGPLRLAGMGAAALAELAALVADWEGPAVDAWRNDIAELLEAE